MAIITIVPQSQSTNFQDVTWVSLTTADAGYIDIRDGDTLLVKHADAGSQAIRLNTQASLDGMTIPSRTITVPTATIRSLINMNWDQFRTSDGLITLSPLAVSFSVACIKGANRG